MILLHPHSSNFTGSSSVPRAVLYSLFGIGCSRDARMLGWVHLAPLKPETHHHSERGSASPAAKPGASARREVSPCHHFEALLALSSNSGCFQLLPTGTQENTAKTPNGRYTLQTCLRPEIMT
ncbi:hypothetical protein E2C01_045116 [Portunus trituberculatus]|uniref:Uncharacterized protein n=1 Tax=Portunus trituberculatus TaxID=210409 RepID=A0A5B7FXE7_PORTR|nr:hypothetical protein [Portunus trituberculatus]